VPRFVTLHADRVNLRTGPGDRYPIEWVLTRKEMPVEIPGSLSIGGASATGRARALGA